MARPLLDALRRQRKRWLGTGPWRALPIETLLALRHPDRPWHAPESADGVVAAIPHAAEAFPRGHALLGQPELPALMADGPPRFRTEGIAPAGTTTFWSLESAGVLGDGGLVYCPQHRAAVAPLARTIRHAPGDHPELGRDRPVTAQLPGVSLLLAGPFGHAHYHLLWDQLARLALLPPALRAAVDHYLIGMPATPCIRDWLHTAGVPLDRVVWLENSSHLRCAQLLFSNLPCEVTQPRAAVLAALRTLLGAPTPANPQRWLWLTRRGQARRDLTWEDRILAAFPRFERLDLAALPARAQVDAFASAAVVAGPHGSGMANLAFVQRGGDLVELLDASQVNDPLYARTAHLAGWRPAWARVDFRTPAESDALVAALKARLPA